MTPDKSRLLPGTRMYLAISIRQFMHKSFTHTVALHNSLRQSKRQSSTSLPSSPHVCSTVAQFRDNYQTLGLPNLDRGAFDSLRNR